MIFLFLSINYTERSLQCQAGMKGFGSERLFIKNTPLEKMYSLDTHSVLHYIGHAKSWFHHA